MFSTKQRTGLVAGLIALAGSVSGAQVFQDISGTQVNERAWDVEKTADGGYVTVGHVNEGPFGQEDIIVSRFDSDGKLVWDVVYGLDGRDVGLSIARDGEGGFIVAGETTSSSPGRDLLLMRLRADGSIVWARTYNGDFLGDPLHPLDGVEVERVPGGGFAAVHHYGGNPTLLRVRGDGSLAFHRAYIVDLSNQGFEQQIAFTDLKIDREEPGIVVSGTREEDLGQGDVQQDFLVSRFTMDGDPVYMRAIDTGSIKNEGHHVNEKGCGIDFAVGDSGEILIGGITDFGVPGQFGLQIVKVDLEGVPLDVKTYDISPGLEVTGRGLVPGYASIRADRPGTVGFAATLVDSVEMRTWAALLETDTFTLLPNWMTRFKGNSDAQATVPVMGGCGYAVAASTIDDVEGFGGFDTYLIKTDDAGLTDCLATRLQPEVRTPAVFCDHYNPQWAAYDNVIPWQPRTIRHNAAQNELCYRCGCEPCPPDLDEDCDADGDDFFLYLDYFASGDPRADMDGDGDGDADDFFLYLDLFAAGC